MNNMNQRQNMGQNPSQSECKRLMRLIQTYSFAVTEAVLYLDTHPTCTKALKFYEKYNRLRAEAVEAYERKCGPLTMYGANIEDGWKWVSEPWPWEC